MMGWIPLDSNGFQWIHTDLDGLFVAFVRWIDLRWKRLVRKSRRWTRKCRAKMDESMQSMPEDRLELTTSVATWGSLPIISTFHFFLFLFID